jgi:hypothetical protein
MHSNRLINSKYRILVIEYAEVSNQWLPAAQRQPQASLNRREATKGSVMGSRKYTVLLSENLRFPRNWLLSVED